MKFLFIVSLAAFTWAGEAKGMTIKNDYGGYIVDYFHAVDDLRAKHTPVAIIGDCRSACTLYLGAGDVCVSRTATLRFHGPSISGQPFPPELFDKLSRMMAAYYPEPIRSWYLREARYRIVGTATISGAELIRLGMRECAR